MPYDWDPDWPLLPEWMRLRADKNTVERLVFEDEGGPFETQAEATHDVEMKLVDMANMLLGLAAGLNRVRHELESDGAPSPGAPSIHPHNA